MRCYCKIKKIESLVEVGAEATKSTKEAGEKTDVIIYNGIIITACQRGILGKEGVIKGVKKESIVIGISTVGPMITREVSQKSLSPGFAERQ
jgi:2-hydroxy-3-oxopropionate reductase